MRATFISFFFLFLFFSFSSFAFAAPAITKVLAEVVKEADGIGAVVRFGKNFNKLPLGKFRGVFALDLASKKAGKVNLNLFHGNVGGRHTRQISLKAINVACHNATFKGHKAKKAKWLVTTTEEVQIVGLGGGLYYLGPASVGERVTEVVTELYKK